MRWRSLVLLWIVFATVPPAFAGQRFDSPTAVSPGETQAIVGIERRCPTFSWSLPEGRSAVELRVTQLVEGVSGDEALPVVLGRRLPPGTHSWTPSLGHCLVPGEAYGWSVRQRWGDRAGPWSEPLFFEVSERDATCDHPATWQHDHAGRRERATPAGRGPGGDDSPRPSVAGAPRRSVTEGANRGLGGVAAVRGEQLDPAGTTYGVAGRSESPDGAGLAAANGAGGVDLLLDGSADGEIDTSLSQAGIDRASADSVTFSIGNSDGGGLTLMIDGVPAVTTANDRDTLGALACASGQLARWDGSAWICDLDQDTDTDTLAGLPCTPGEVAKRDGAGWTCATDEDRLAELACATGEVAKWDGTTWICAADDDGAGLALGHGLLMEDGQVRLDLSALTQKTTIDDSADVGRYSSLAIGTDGLGLIAYFDVSNVDLKTAHCHNTACSSATVSTVDSAGSVGGYAALAIGSDGLGLISYQSGNGNPHLLVAHCNDLACTGATSSIIDTAGTVGAFSSITIGADGLGLVAYHNASGGALKVAHCDDVPCSSATVTTLDSAGSAGRYTSITIGADGLGLISYFDTTSRELRVAHCNNMACTSATTAVVDTVGGFPGHAGTSIAIGSDGLPIIAYTALGGELRLAHCNNATCTLATLTSIEPVGAGAPSLVVDSDGLGLISYRHDTDDDLKLVNCLDLFCTTFTLDTLDRIGSVGSFGSMKLGGDGLPLISYVDETNTSLKVAALRIGAGW